ncbi:cell division protein, partial [Undibacterium sp. CCC3.4]|nr:cell division protein [Undibacterium sp. CCC3.4]
DAQVRGDKLLPLLQKLRQVGNKPVQFIGQNSSNGEWEAVSRGSVYNALAAGVQLANRNSPLNELEYSELVMRLHEITETIGASPDVPD